MRNIMKLICIQVFSYFNFRFKVFEIIVDLVDSVFVEGVFDYINIMLDKLKKDEMSYILVFSGCIRQYFIVLNG